MSNTSIEGTAQEKKLYELIWKRALASQMAEAKVLNTSVKVSSDKRSETFSLQTTETVFDGFLKIYNEGTDDEEQDEETLSMPALNKGDILQEKGISAECKFTQPPYRYSEATLVKKLEELGIGRPSTYAPTISTLTTGRGYIVKGDKEGRKVAVRNLTLKGSTISETEKSETIGAEKGKLLPQDIGIIVTDYLTGNFSAIMDYDFTANVEKDFDSVAEGKAVWNSVISKFYGPFHSTVETALEDKQYSHVEREIGIDPSDGLAIIAKFGQFGPYIQKGDGENRQYASLSKGQLIESLTLEDALKLFQLPRKLGQVDGEDVTILKGRFGPYIKHGTKNISLPRGLDPLKATLEQCTEIIRKAAAAPDTHTPVKEFGDSGIAVYNGIYGPYIKYNGANYKIPKGTDAAALTEADCKALIEAAPAAAPRKYKRYKKTK